MHPTTTSEWLCYFLRMGSASIENAYGILNAAASPAGRNETCAATLTSINWPDLLHLAQRHGVVPLLYHRLKASGLQEHVPQRTFHILHQVYLHTAARNMRLYHELAQILTLLKENNIPVIILKGAYLAEAVYANIALRTMADIDLLLKEADLQRAVKLLHESGYAPDTTSATTAHLPPFIKPGGIRVELHWTLEDPASPFTIDTAGLWERASATLIAKVPAYGLGWEDLLLYVCLHLAFRHQFRIGLRALCDLEAILQHAHHELNWHTVVSRACQWKVERCVYLSLHYARNMLLVDIPMSRLEMFRIPPPAPEFVMEVKRSILMDDNCRPHMSPNMVRLWSAERFRERILFFFECVFPSPREIARVYAVSPLSFRVFLYYVERLKNLSLRYGRLVWKLFRHDAEIVNGVLQQNTLIQWLIPHPPPRKQEKHQ